MQGRTSKYTRTTRRWYAAGCPGMASSSHCFSIESLYGRVWFCASSATRSVSRDSLYAAGSTRALSANPPIHIVLQHTERHRSAAEHDVVKCADIEARAEGLLGAFAQLLDLQFAELVRQRLTGPGDIAIHFRLHLVQRQRGARGHVVDGLLSRPSER